MVGEAVDTHVRVFGALPKGKLGAGKKWLWGRIRWRRKGSTDWSPARTFRLNGNFDGSGVVSLNQLQPGTRYACQAGWAVGESVSV